MEKVGNLLTRGQLVVSFSAPEIQPMEAAYEVIRDNVWEPIVRAGQIAFMILMTLIGVALVMALIVWVAKVHSYCRRGQAQSSVKKSESDHKRKSPADHRRWVSKRKQKEEPEPKPLV